MKPSLSILLGVGTLGASMGFPKTRLSQKSQTSPFWFCFSWHLPARLVALLSRVVERATAPSRMVNLGQRPHRGQLGQRGRHEAVESVVLPEFLLLFLVLERCWEVLDVHICEPAAGFGEVFGTNCAQVCLNTTVFVVVCWTFLNSLRLRLRASVSWYTILCPSAWFSPHPPSIDVRPT